MEGAHMRGALRKFIVASSVAAVSMVGWAGFAPAAHAEEGDYDGCHYGETIVGSPHADRLVGTNCDDTIYGLGGADRIRGLFGDDVLFGNRGNDLISDPSNTGVIHGGRGWDTCVVRADSQIQVLGCEDVVEI
jgi:Ca2+-binding RTX toxin-like protein